MKPVSAEFLATFVLVFCGTGAIVIDAHMGGLVTNLGVAAAFGLPVMALIYIFGRVSGAHMNPAVSVALVLGGLFPARQLPTYIFAQVAGAFAASALLSLLFPEDEFLGATIPVVSDLHTFVLEFFLTMFLMFTVLMFAISDTPSKRFAGMAIGGVVLLEAFFAGPFTGASMNPARSLAPALVSGHTDSLGVYLLATFGGALAALPIAKFFRKKKIKIQ